MNVWNRWKRQIVCVVAGLVLGALSLWSAQHEAEIVDGCLERGGYGDEPVIYDLVIEGASEEPFSCQVEIHAQEYDENAVQEVFDLILQSLPDRIRGDNDSLLMVRSDLNLPDSFEEYGIQARWSSETPEVMDSFGRIRTEDCPEEGVDVNLNVELTAGGYTREDVLAVRVYPELLTEEQLVQKELQMLLQAVDEQRPWQKMVQLPQSYRGRALKYEIPRSYDYMIFPVLGILMAMLFRAKEKQDAVTIRKKRDQQLLLEYADVVYQLMVFTGAGLTVGRAWEQIVDNYEKRLKAGRCVESPAYEEMAAAYGRMQCGESEGKAIMDFGRRCQLQPYLKLSTILIQNRRTGLKDLQMILEQEMVVAWEQQKNTARRMGEEAGTKLLAPLFLMLIVVMVIIMVPAMWSMG